MNHPEFPTHQHAQRPEAELIDNLVPPPRTAEMPWHSWTSDQEEGFEPTVVRGTD